MSVRALKKKEINLNNQKQKIVKESRNELKIRRRTISAPNLSNLENLEFQFLQSKKMFKSESDNISLDKNKQQVTDETQDNLINSKSEVCLKTISVHNNTRNDKLHQYQRRRLSSNDLVNSLSSFSSSDGGVRVRIPIIGYEVMEERARYTVRFLECKRGAH